VNRKPLGQPLFCSVLLSGDTIPKRSVSGHVPSRTAPGFQVSAFSAFSARQSPAPGTAPGRASTRAPTRAPGTAPGREPGREPTREPGRESARWSTRESGRESTREPTRGSTREPGRASTRADPPEGSEFGHVAQIRRVAAKNCAKTGVLISTLRSWQNWSFPPEMRFRVREISGGSLAKTLGRNEDLRDSPWFGCQGTRSRSEAFRVMSPAGQSRVFADFAPAVPVLRASLSVSIRVHPWLCSCLCALCVLGGSLRILRVSVFSVLSVVLSRDSGISVGRRKRLTNQEFRL
jgi:hypothetical protein